MKSQRYYSKGWIKTKWLFVGDILMIIAFLAQSLSLFLILVGLLTATIAVLPIFREPTAEELLIRENRFWQKAAGLPMGSLEREVFTWQARMCMADRIGILDEEER